MKNQDKIPKIIHYCWFGNKEKPKKIKKCIESWKNILVDYEIIEWNEENFKLDNEFVAQAYSLGKFAFVSDYVRVNVLYNYGGIYLDTDVEVLKSFDIFLEDESFWGFEEKNRIATSTIGCKKGNKLIKLFLDSYEGKRFVLEDGTVDTTPNVCKITEIILSKGGVLNGKHQELKGLATIYEQEYFSPYDYINCYMKRTNNTYAIHHFYKSWLPFSNKVKGNIKRFVAMLIGGNRISKIRQILTGEWKGDRYL